ncbi:MAG: helix-turn-helix transcriptional regulator [Halioglobus sp.]
MAKNEDESPIVDSSRSAVGARLAIVRHEVGCTQTEFASQLGVSMRTYHHYEKGQRSCGIDALAILAIKFGVDLNWLIIGLEDVASVIEPDELNAFSKSLDGYLANNKITLSEARRRAVTAKWYQGRQQKRTTFRDDIAFWVEMVR